jgi:purine-nucleoside phosphorylase
MDDSEARQVSEAVRYLTERGATAPAIGVVLGSGLGSFVERLAEPRVFPYSEIPHMAPSSVEGHAGKLHVGRIGRVGVACMQGRVHLYEGHPLDRVVFGVRLLSGLGCKSVLLTNAAGGVAVGFRTGDFMLITDHLNLTGQNPLVGPTPAGGSRFCDMSAAYDEGLRALAFAAARELGIELKHGVYAALLGPSYETPAEIRMLRTLGADAVGMSTALEVIALRQRNVRVGALSLITNLAAGLGAAPLDHAEVQASAALARESFGALLRRWIELVAEESAS